MNRGNVYAFSLRPSRINELADELESCHAAVITDLERFIQFLESCADDDDVSATEDGKER